MTDLREAPTNTELWKPLLMKVCAYAQTSPDPSTQNAGVLCYATSPIEATWSVNEFPRGVKYTDERWERPLKYEVIEHAERNAIYAAARAGVRTDGLTLVAAWAACSDCARAIIQAGISRLVTLRPDKAPTHAAWDDSINIAMTMLNEAGVEVVYIDGPLGCEFSILRNGELFNP